VAGGSEGVGASFARQLAERGLNLFLIALEAEPLAKLADEIRAATGVQVRDHVIDLTAPDMVQRIEKATSGLDVGLLVYTAGAAAPSEFLDQPFEHSRKIVQLNPIGQLTLAYHFGRIMRARGGGGMIFVGSLAGVVGGGGHTVYCAAKAFTQTLAEGLWSEFKPYGIDVSCIIIGTTRTPFMERSGYNIDHADFIWSEPDDVAAHALANIANGPVTVPANLVESFDFLRLAERADAAAMTAAGIKVLNSTRKAGRQVE
jgi:short-subunit dehydrogenase